ncbi:hypothetical protein [Sphingobium lactosutens]|uniref:Uncharacterized protein n=1 Tax=Sphingobium lactosutens DS20 TaxID=1331060 RepID=T0HL23_9SPHN|nr:hypothetical protein [Sphingobium lactosutens]EQB12838.1 hypothetical protein RLDS_18865 [Sphingobium lactosutens DS20]
MVAATDIAAERNSVPVYAGDHIRVTAIEANHYQSSPSIPLPHMPRALTYCIEVGGKTAATAGVKPVVKHYDYDDIRCHFP